MTLIETLKNPKLYDHPVTGFQVMETHISWVLLTGPFAYKLKKPVDLGFLDFRTLESRKHFCEEEIRINRRLAPQLYLEVVPITGTLESPQIQGTGKPFEYAIKMVQFPEENRLDHLFEKAMTEGNSSRLAPAIDELALLVADFHQQIAKAGPDSLLGTPENIRKAVDDCLDPLAGLPHAQTLRTWCDTEFRRLEPVFRSRKAEGFIREGHGDLHLANIVEYKNKIVPFDAIEFCDDFRWIDVLNEIAFTLMDLEARQFTPLAHRFLNLYLEQTGDYEGLSVLRYYKVYRALVRAKVANIRAAQESGESQRQCKKERDRYLALAASFVQTPMPRLAITHGFSGSGKTYGSQKVLEEWGAIRLRTDVERKRMFGGGRSDVESGTYTLEITDRVYDHLLKQSESLLKKGYSVIVDGTFLKVSQRKLFCDLAKKMRLSFQILDFDFPETILQERITKRLREGQDASEADIKVLKHQQESQEPLTEEERRLALKNLLPE